MNEEYLVTVICLAYNHENYIKETLESFIHQKTSFKVKYLIHDDCSTDSTRNIIKEYEQKFPDLIYPIYEQENQYSKHRDFMIDLIKKIDTKYIAFCEGDDYWIDELKLEKQVKYMENNDKCSLVLTNGLRLDDKIKNFKNINPYNNTGIISLKDIFIEPKGLPPTASMLCRTSLFKDYPKEELFAPVGDRPIRMFLAINGECYYMNDITCVYRTNNNFSFGGTINRDKEKSKKLLDDMIVYFNKFDQYTKFKYHELIKIMIEREKYLFYLREKKYTLVNSNVYYKKYFSIKQKIINQIKWHVPEVVVRKIKLMIYGNRK